MVYKDYPLKIQATGELNENGLPINVAVNLLFKGGAVAQFIASGRAMSNNIATITGTKGVAVINHPFHSPTSLTVNGKVEEFDLVKTKTKVIHENSENFIHEANAVADAIASNKLELERASQDDSIKIVRIIEEIHRQINASFD